MHCKPNRAKSDENVIIIWFFLLLNYSLGSVRRCKSTESDTGPTVRLCSRVVLMASSLRTCTKQYRPVIEAASILNFPTDHSRVNQPAFLLPRHTGLRVTPVLWVYAGPGLLARMHVTTQLSCKMGRYLGLKVDSPPAHRSSYLVVLLSQSSQVLPFSPLDLWTVTRQPVSRARGRGR